VIMLSLPSIPRLFGRRELIPMTDKDCLGT
jgi:hypothetical protein